MRPYVREWRSEISRWHSSNDILPSTYAHMICSYVIFLALCAGGCVQANVVRASVVDLTIQTMFAIMAWYRQRAVTGFTNDQFFAFVDASEIAIGDQDIPLDNSINAGVFLSFYVMCRHFTSPC
jgi:hypothetical protein